MYKLRDHQKRAVDGFFKAKTAGYFLYHDMGLGKTLTALHIANKLRQRFNDNLQLGTKTLILCPKAIVTVWEDEIVKWCKEDSRHFLIIPYTQMHNNLFNLSKQEIGLIVMDEFHYLRNKTTLRLERFIELLKCIEKNNKHLDTRLLGLSGTPLLNHGGDLYNLWGRTSHKQYQ